MEIIVSVATKTSDWDRPVSVAQQQGPRFLEAVEGKKADLPAGTKDVCQREAEHPSDSDPRDHFTGVCWDGQMARREQPCISQLRSSDCTATSFEQLCHGWRKCEEL
ncbi:hypothetical protein ACJ73_05141 [Blastomyces percursus]|uniref:Uncharacterized protein n=1 Tax=Blastomyces percursus TaxID=1658174 RepID=A0A1J9R675_9EURO|nr:hypothetical protein ACJ73_05141 [Blastomyces percursus]